MIDVLQAFKEGGWTMYIVLLFDLVGMAVVPIALILAIVARLRGSMRTVSLVGGVLALIVSLLPMCAGVGGYLLGMSKVEAAIVHADPEYREMLRDAGEEEAGHNLTFGLGSGFSCLLPAVIALLLVPPKREAPVE